MTYLIAIFTYVGTAYGLMCIAQSCGLRQPWLAWVPFANIYLLGAVGDHYMTRNERRETKQRILLLVLYIVLSVVGTINICIMFSGFFRFFDNAGIDFWRLMLDSDYEDEMEILFTEYFSGMTEAGVRDTLVELLATTLGPLLFTLPISIVYIVFYYIALHRVYKLMDPSNSTVYTVLSIFFSLAIPIVFLLIAKKNPVYPADGPFFGVEAGTYDTGSRTETDTYSI